MYVLTGQGLRSQTVLHVRGDEVKDEENRPHDQRESGHMDNLTELRQETDSAGPNKIEGKGELIAILRTKSVPYKGM